jgi:Cdc6-like AAA superfamily ATPase
MIVRFRPIRLAPRQVRNMEFALDWVFDEETTQEEMYEMAASERIDWVLSGFSATIIAYGQTGSGKTHTVSLGTYKARHPRPLPLPLAHTVSLGTSK